MRLWFGPSRRPLALENDTASNFTILSIALMVFLAFVVMCGNMVLHNTLEKWRSGLTGQWTVEYPADPDMERAAQRQKVEEAAERLSRLDGISQAKPLTDAETRALIEPWIDVSLAGQEAEDGASVQFPIPFLIHVELSNQSPPDRREIKRVLESVDPGMRLDDHGAWLHQTLSIAYAVETGLGLTAALILIVAMAVIAGTAQSAMSVHRDALEILHTMGATDTFIAGIFRTHGLRLGLQGAAAGAFAGFVLLWPIRSILVNTGLQAELSNLQWGLLAAMPFGAAALCALTAYIVVLRNLNKMP